MTLDLTIFLLGSAIAIGLLAYAERRNQRPRSAVCGLCGGRDGKHMADCWVRTARKDSAA